MQTTIKMLRQLGLVLMISFCLTTIANAQSPADDPGIGGPGSPGDGPGGDGGPVVPFDGGMSLMLLVSSIGYGFLSIKKTVLLNALSNNTSGLGTFIK